jgi:acyl-lipid omega-6 desaturase (Delta-12 desaturase)
MHEPNHSFDSLRAVLPRGVYKTSYVWALGLTSTVLILQFALIWLCYQAPSLGILLVFSIARGLAMGPVFIVGHDACHDSLSPSSKLNYWLGQLCFLPSWHSFTAWKVRHNHIHHRHTNLRELDSGYPPKTASEYAAATKLEKWRYRASRTPLGAGLLYLPEVFHHQLLPNQASRKSYQKVDTRFTFERWLVRLYITLELALLSGALAALGLINPPPMGGLWVLGCTFFLSHAIWLWQMGFTTFLHHFHPDIAWYSSDNNTSQSAAQRQLVSTVHVDLKTVHNLMLNIFVHTAHHIDTAIPLYRLRKAQLALQAQFKTQITRYTFSLKRSLACFSVCKLWDDKANRWRGYEKA